LTYETNPILSIFFHLAAALVLASGGQGDSFRESRPPGPVKHLQKLLFIAAKGKKHVFCLHPGLDHVK
jgi:hypothetical protein